MLRFVGIGAATRSRSAWFLSRSLAETAAACRERTIPSVLGGALRIRAGEHGRGLEKPQLHVDGRAIEKYDYKLA